MAKLKDKVTNALNEARMLVLGAQVLVGFQFRSVFEQGFDSLPLPSQLLKLGGLGLMLVAVALIISPAAYHRLVEAGEDTHEIHRYTTRLMNWALLPFALGLGVDLCVAAQKVIGWKTGVAAGVGGALLAASLWYGLEFYMRRERAGEIEEAKRKGGGVGEENAGENAEGKAAEKGVEKGVGGDAGQKLSDKIKHVLTECRVVLPGSQALLGFQFIVILTESFERLPDSSQYVHLVSLGLNALAIVLLMTPAAYHRIVERGEETEHFHRFASKMLVASLVPLALALAGDVYVVVRKVTDSQLVSVVSGLVILAIFWELWFGLTLYRRTQRQYAD
jgi:DMSO reductase anchor subunit